jgi:hypothetical protein
MEINRRGINEMYPPVGQLAGSVAEAVASSATLFSAAAFSAAARSASVVMVLTKAKATQMNEGEQSRRRRSPKT